MSGAAPGTSSCEMIDNVPQSRIYKDVEHGRVTASRDLHRLHGLFAQDVLTRQQEQSRLYKPSRLHQDQTVDFGAVVHRPLRDRSWAAISWIIATVKQGGEDPAKVERVRSTRRCGKFLEGRVRRPRTNWRSHRAPPTSGRMDARGIERIDGFGGKSSMRSRRAQVYGGDAGASYKTASEDPWVSKATHGRRCSDGGEAAGLGAGNGSHTFVGQPVERVDIAEEPAVTKTTASSCRRSMRGPRPWPAPIDRNTGVPLTASFPDLKFPSLQHAKLSNGHQCRSSSSATTSPVVQISRYESRTSASGGRHRRRSPAAARLAMGSCCRKARKTRDSLADSRNAPSPLGAEPGRQCSSLDQQQFLSMNALSKPNLEPIRSSCMPTC